MVNCVEIVRPFVEAITGQDDVQLLGGIGSVALNHPETVIVPNEKRIIAPADLDMPQYRDDGNLRDFDVLVLSSNPFRVADIELTAEGTIGERLELSVFDLKHADAVQRMKQHPLKQAAQFVSDRYVQETEAGLATAQRVLFPFASEMDLEYLETWRLFLGDKDKRPAPVPHPGSVVLNYLTRSISGLRPKDEMKVSEIADNLSAKSPELRDWMVDGPGRSQMEFARILQRLSRPGVLAVGQSLDVRPAAGRLSEHPAFMIPEAPNLTKRVVIGQAYAKSRALRQFESNGKIVTLWQKYGEPAAAKIIHNR